MIIIRMIVVATLFFVCGCMPSTRLMKHEKVYEKTINLDGIPRAQIFDRSLEWLKQNVADNPGGVVADRSNWSISCSGRMVRPFSAVNLTSTGDLTYLARGTVMDESLTLSFELQSVVEPRTYSSSTYFSPGGTYPVVQADLSGARKNFDLLADTLRRYLLKEPGR